MKLVYVNWILLVLYFSHTDSVKLSKKITDLLQEVLNESNKDVQKKSAGNSIKPAEKDKVANEAPAKQAVVVKDAEEEAKKETKNQPKKDLEQKAKTRDEVEKDEENLKDDNKLVQTLTDLLQDIIAKKRANTTLQDDIEEIMDNDIAKEKTTKRTDHSHQCAGGAFDKAVDNIADIIKEGIMDKLKNDFNQKFDESDEEIFRKAKKDAKPSPWIRRRSRSWWGKKK